MSEKSVTFTDQEFDAMKNGARISIDGIPFCHEEFSESHRGTDGTVYKISDLDIGSMKDGEESQWAFGTGTYEDTNSVSLDISVDTTGASEEQRQMYEEMVEIFEDGFETFVQKNLDYDSSFQSAGEIEQALDSGEGPFDSAFESNLYKTFTRIQDKNQRFYSLAFANNEDRVGEDVAETSGDAMVYWAMVTWMLQYGQ